MDFFISIYNVFLEQPVFNVLIFLAQNVPGKDFGVAVILLTLVIRLGSYPLGAQGVRAQKKFAELQPKIKEVQEKYKNNKQEQTRAMLELYKTAKVNPFATVLPALVQLPIFIVLYQIFSHGLQPEEFANLYSFIAAPENISTSFLGILDLNERSLPVAVLAGASLFLQLKQAVPRDKKKTKKEKPDVASLMQKQMPYIFPAVIVWIAASLPAAFGLYLIVSTVFTVWQHWFITKREQHDQQRAVENN